MKTYYDILGISNKATQEEIKKAYKSLAKIHHPDNKDSGDEFLMSQINEAYNTLKDTNERKTYDNKLQYGFDIKFNKTANGVDDFHTIFRKDKIEKSLNEIFKYFGHNFHERASRSGKNHRNKNINAQLEIELKDAYFGFEEELTILTADGVKKRINLNIPKGIQNGGRIRILGMGENKGGPPGDLIVEIIIKEHDKFIREGHNLELLISIDAFDAIFGIDYEFVHLNDKIYKLKIPPGTQPNTEFKMVGLGMPEIESLDKFGDLYCTVSVTIPNGNDLKKSKYKEKIKKTLDILV